MKAAPALARAEWTLLTAVLSAWVLVHHAEVAWPRFVLAFAAIDLVGYLPGALAFRRSRGAPLPPVYHWLYNLTHNFVTGGAVVLAWALARGGWEWAMLAIPIHLAGDRGLFGNGFKPSGEPFERSSAPGAVHG
jgi:hypothetical protein